MKCETVLERLVEYLQREAGAAQADLIRRHLESCETCRATARELSDTLELLCRDSSRRTPIPDRLSRERRARITRSYRHPLVFWVETHHTVVSVAIALVIVLLVAATAIWFSQRPGDSLPRDGIEIWIDGGPDRSPDGEAEPPPSED
jgi:predicted anti-sigma-YlaC factor YlaD